MNARISGPRVEDLLVGAQSSVSEGTSPITAPAQGGVGWQYSQSATRLPPDSSDASSPKPARIGRFMSMKIGHGIVRVPDAQQPPRREIEGAVRRLAVEAHGPAAFPYDRPVAGQANVS